MKNSIKRAQSQARLSFAERENFRPKVRQLKKTILTLVALLALTTQAWATDVYLVGNGTGNWVNGAVWDPGVAGNKMTEQNGVYSITFTNVAANSELFFKFAINGTWDENYGCSSDDENKLNKTLSNIELFGTNFLFRLTESADVTISFNPSEMTYMISTKGMKVGDDAPTGPKVDWDKAKKTGKFTMPGGNVTLEPEYYPQAALTAAPTAINDVPATTDGAIVSAGTVANIGSTETAQGTVMYYVSQTALDDDALLALDADQWTADVPTAESLAQGQAYVYYYVRGNDSDNDEENFSDGDILAANALTVTIAAEPTYAVTFAEGTDPNEWTASPNTGVKKGTEVTVTYSGSKKVIGVKAEKKAAEPVADIIWDVTNVSDLEVAGTESYEKEGVTLRANVHMIQAQWYNYGDPTTAGIGFNANEPGGFTFTAPTGKKFTKIEMKALGSGEWASANLGTGWAFNADMEKQIFTVTWTGSAASTVDLLKDTDDFSGPNVKSIAFYLSE